LGELKARGFDDAKLGGLSSRIIEELRRALDTARNHNAENVFKEGVAAGTVQFRLRLDGKNWRLPFAIETNQPEDARKLTNSKGDALTKSLFAPIYENDLNSDEQAVAGYLDDDKALKWWHRNVARRQYGLQGWKRAKVYPDFLFAVQREGKGNRLVILETKGDQLDNLDTAYKRNLLSHLSNNFCWNKALPAGTLEIYADNGETVECALVLMSEWQADLPKLLA
jgi:type III restriction enzyme